MVGILDGSGPAYARIPVSHRLFFIRTQARKLRCRRIPGYGKRKRLTAAIHRRGNRDVARLAR